MMDINMADVQDSEARVATAPAVAPILLSQVEALIVVAEAGSIGAAAERLFVTQPALTARIQALEAALGAKLLVRGRTGSRLTETGRAYLPFARRALSALASGRETVHEIASGSAGRLAIGAAPAVSTYVLPAVLHHFQETHPRVQLVVRSGHSEDVLQMVLREEVELGLMRPIGHADVTSVLIYEDELVLVVHRGHPFASTGTIRMAQMASEHLILFDRTSSYHELTSALVRQAGIAPRGTIEVDNIDAAKRMVEQRLGIALLPQTSVQLEIGTGRLVPVVVSDLPPIRRQIVAARRRDAGDPSPAAAAFLAILEEMRPEPGERRSLLA
jgi:DNA-binding transcriptional LysR family regulator